MFVLEQSKIVPMPFPIKLHQPPTQTSPEIARPPGKSGGQGPMMCEPTPTVSCRTPPFGAFRSKSAHMLHLAIVPVGIVLP